MENETFSKIYEDYARQVFHFLLKLSGNYDTAEELTQETFVKAYLSLDGFRGECRLFVWLCQNSPNRTSPFSYTAYFPSCPTKR